MHTTTTWQLASFTVLTLIDGNKCCSSADASERGLLPLKLFITSSGAVCHSVDGICGRCCAATTSRMRLYEWMRMVNVGPYWEDLGKVAVAFLRAVYQLPATHPGGFGDAQVVCMRCGGEHEKMGNPKWPSNCHKVLELVVAGLSEVDRGVWLHDLAQISFQILHVHLCLPCVVCGSSGAWGSRTECLPRRKTKLLGSLDLAWLCTCVRFFFCGQ